MSGSAMRNTMGSKITAACGNNCAVCPRYTAHPYEKTEAELRHTAELWMKIGYRDHIVSNEEISCVGCKPENWCRYHVVKCCRDKGIANCSECMEYPCRNIKECFEITKSFEPVCKKICTEAEYFQMKAAFFEKEQNLAEMALDPAGMKAVSSSKRQSTEEVFSAADNLIDDETAVNE